MYGVLPGGVFDGAPLTPPRGVVKSTPGNHQLQTRTEDQDTIDTIYDEFLQILYNEMDSELEYKDFSDRTNHDIVYVSSAGIMN